MSTTSAESIRNSVQAIIDADLSHTETLTAVWSLIPKEYHVTPPPMNRAAFAGTLAELGTKVQAAIAELPRALMTEA